MPVSITIPPHSAASARVARWLVAPGTRVRAGQPVVTIVTGTTEIDVEAATDGRLGQIRLDAGSAGQIGDILAEIE